MYKKITLVVVIIIICTLSFGGCTKLDNVKYKLGLKNKDFEYMKQDKIKKILIQSNRDKGFKFIVTDNAVINEVYDILSSSKEVGNKSSLTADYILEIHQKGGKIFKFNYVAGLDKKEGGNLYNDKKVYIVSSRLDNDILGAFENIRKPKNFKNIYYGSILKVLDRYMGEEKDNKNVAMHYNKGDKVSVNIEDDLDVSKFVLSVDLEDFKSNLLNNYSSNVLLKENEGNKDYNTFMNVKTDGFKNDIYKATMTFSKDKNSKEKIYYVWATYKNIAWNIEVYEDKKPDKF